MDQTAFRTEIGGILETMLRDRELSIDEVASQTDVTYEQVRRVIRGVTVPSKSLLRRICATLKVDFEELNRVRARDDIRRKHGPSALREFTLEPDLEKLENAWPNLHEQQRRHLVWMVESFLKQNSTPSG